ncbi:MAG: hypothetical protein Q9220_006000 [cf. Caloplaca sp. 1 TL-2023]
MAVTVAEDGSLPQTTEAIKSRAEDQGIEAFKDIAFGSIAGIIGKVIEYPFDTIKVRLQTQPHPPIYTGPLDCFRQSLFSPEGGLRSLYRGVSAPLLGAAVETSSLFFSYRIAQSALQTLFPTLPQGKGEKLPLSALVACGAISGAATSLLLTPIELVKCKLQYPVTTSRPGGSTRQYRHPTPLQVVGSVFRNHGLLGLWRGQLGTLIRETGGSAAWFGCYEGVLSLLSSHHSPSPATSSRASSSSPLYHQLLAGAAAGVSYNFVFFPADTIKSRMQTEESLAATTGGKKPIQSRFWGCGVELWRQQGLRGLYRGCGITVARAAPSSAVIFALYEGLRDWAG